MKPDHYYPPNLKKVTFQSIYRRVVELARAVQDLSRSVDWNTFRSPIKVVRFSDFSEACG
jgi:hypothetical protein